MRLAENRSSIPRIASRGLRKAAAICWPGQHECGSQTIELQKIHRFPNHHPSVNVAPGFANNRNSHIATTNYELERNQIRKITLDQMSRSNKKVPSNLSPLDKIGWLAGESAEFRNWAQENGYWRRLAKRENVYFAGDEPDGIYGLAHGILEISFPLDDTINVSIHRAEPGFWMGESALFSNERRMVSLTAATDCLVFHIPAAAMEHLTVEKPESWRAFYRQSHINQKQTARLLAESIALSPRARFARLLLRLSENGGDIDGSQESLGALLGLRITTCKRIVASLVAVKAIESGYGKIRIRDKEVLEKFAVEETDVPVVKNSGVTNYLIYKTRQDGRG